MGESHPVRVFAALAQCAAVLIPATLSVIVGCGDPARSAGAFNDVICREPDWNFGVVDPGKTQRLRCEFALENMSRRSVRIEKVTTSCGCIIFESPPHTVEAGATVKLPVGVQISGQPGPFSKAIAVHLDTVPPSIIQLRILGQLAATPRMYSVPKIIDFGDISQGEIKLRTVRVAREDGTFVNCRKAESESSAIRLEPRSAEENQAVYELNVSLDGSSLRPGEFATIVRVTSNRQNDHEIHIPIKANVMPIFTGLVSSIVIDRLSSDEFEDRPLVSASQEIPAIENVAYEGDGGVTIELVAVESRNSLIAIPAIRVRQVGPLPQDSVCRGSLLVSLAGRSKAVTIPITVVLLK